MSGLCYRPGCGKPETDPVHAQPWGANTHPFWWCAR